QCIWCVNEDNYTQKDCKDFKEAEGKQLVFWKDRNIHASLIGLPLPPNFNKREMKKLLAKMMAKEATTYGLMVDDGKSCRNFWPNAIKIAKKGMVAHKTLCQVGDQIRKTTGWKDSIDFVSIYAHLVKAQAQD
ncbi:hypothetical protein L7F22_016332, partial [Adiantum nelumboides]|nr:hypothetical protein [Adiantum nelumboides]